MKPQPAAQASWSSLIRAAQRAGRIPTAVVSPCDELSLRAALEAADEGLIEPVLIGPRAKIAAAARAVKRSIAALPLIDAPTDEAAAERAVAEAVAGRVAAIMKGSLHSDTVLRPLVHEPRLRTGRRLSHCYVMDLPGRAPFIVTDTVMNIAPTLEEKADIVRNAIDLAHALGMAMPRVAILSATETVSAKMPSTIDAAALAKMAERGQISGAYVDGPFALDDALSAEAVRVKHLVSPVAGRADILVVPNLDAGNILAKELEFLGHADAAGIVVGAKVPVILTGRAERIATRVASCALAALYLAKTSAKRRTTRSARRSTVVAGTS